MKITSSYTNIFFYWRLRFVKGFWAAQTIKIDFLAVVTLKLKCYHFRFVCLFVCLSVHVTFWHSVHLSTCLSVFPSLCLSLCLSFLPHSSKRMLQDDDNSWSTGIQERPNTFMEMIDISSHTSMVSYFHNPASIWPQIKNVEADFAWRIFFLIYVQLNPALTDFKGLTIFFCYRWTSVIANKGNKIN